jgi:hypothetical protein
VEQQEARELAEETKVLGGGIVSVQCGFHLQCIMFQKELYNFESVFKYIQMAYAVF